MWDDLRVKIGRHLHYCWPGRFLDAWGGGGDFFEFDDFPRAEQVEMVRAVEAMLRDFIDDKSDPGLKLDTDARLWNISIP